jgi:hypothetical protein
MNFRSSGMVKQAAKELSSLIRSADPDTRKMEDLLREMPALSNGKVSNNGVDAGSRFGIDHIGIWKKVSDNNRTCYVRDIQFQYDWQNWAPVHNIYPKSDKKRVVLLGESVARGYLYDPAYNPAKELKGLFDASFEMQETEIVDLARIAINMKEILDVLKVCHELTPDLVIIYAGNNWSWAVDLPDKDFDGLSADRDLFGINTIVENSFFDKINQFLKDVHDAFVKRNIPVIFVIPEFNLKDWGCNEIESGLLLLPKSRNEEWVQARAMAEKARLDNDLDNWQTAASQMIEKDKSNPLGYQFLGQLYIARNQKDKARGCLELARDLVFYRGGNVMPRCYGFIRKAILAQAENYGISVVDVPGIFSNIYPDKFPDKSLFLDYCHMTIEGIKIVMRHVTQKVIEILTGIKKEIDEIGPTDIMADNEVAARAHFSAAIINAHNGQPIDVIRYHCRKAIGYSHKVIADMTDFVDFSSRRASSIFCSAFEEIMLKGNMRQYEGGWALTHLRGRKRMDVQLVDILADELNRTGLPLADKIESIRISEHGVAEEPVDLLESFYHDVRHMDSRIEPGLNYRKFKTLTADFTFIIRNSTDKVRLDIAYRAPEIMKNTRCARISVNGIFLPVELPLSRHWSSFSFSIGEDLKKGVNKLTIHWPYNEKPVDLSKIKSLQDFLRDVYPVFGEIYSFTIKICD